MDDLYKKITKLLSSKYPSLRVESITFEHRNPDDMWMKPSILKTGGRELVYEVRTTNDFLPSVNNTEEVSEWFFVMTKMIMDDDINIRVVFVDPYIKRLHLNYL